MKSGFALAFLYGRHPSDRVQMLEEGGSDLVIDGFLHMKLIMRRARPVILEAEDIELNKAA